MSNKISASSMVGKKYNRLTVLAVTKLRKNLKIVVLCQCDCGKKLHVTARSVLISNTKSCGCWAKEWGHLANLKHGGAGTPEFSVWKDLINRCTNPTNKDFHNYGGRGIRVCDRWLHSFENFYKDMGLRPSKNHSIDRFPNNDGDYEPSNCRWALSHQQSRNTRRNLYFEHDGKRLVISDWAKELGVSLSALYQRVHNGMSFEQAIAIPFKPIRKKRRL